MTDKVDGATLLLAIDPLQNLTAEQARDAVVNMDAVLMRAVSGKTVKTSAAEFGAHVAHFGGPEAHFAYLNKVITLTPDHAPNQCQDTSSPSRNPSPKEFPHPPTKPHAPSAGDDDTI